MGRKALHRGLIQERGQEIEGGGGGLHSPALTHHVLEFLNNLMGARNRVGNKVVVPARQAT